MPLGNKWSPERRRRFEEKKRAMERALHEGDATLIRTSPIKRRSDESMLLSGHTTTLRELVDAMEESAANFSLAVAELKAKVLG